MICQNSESGQNLIITHLLRRYVNVFPTLLVDVRVQEEIPNLASIYDFLLPRLWRAFQWTH